MEQEKEKRKGLPAQRNRWLYAVGGFVTGALFTVVAVYLYDVQSAGLGISSGAYTVISFIFVFSLIFLVIAGLIIVAGHVPASTETLRQKPGTPFVVQQLIDGEWQDQMNLTPMMRQKPGETFAVQQFVDGAWQDVLLISAADSDSLLPSLDKDKKPPRRGSSLVWMAVAALLPSLYGVFLSRPTQERDKS